MVVAASRPHHWPWAVGRGDNGSRWAACQWRFNLNFYWGGGDHRGAATEAKPCVFLVSLTAHGTHSHDWNLDLLPSRIS